MPIIIGGGGPARTPALAARYAAEYNAPFTSVERFVEQRERVAAACTAIDRDPASIRYIGRRRRLPRRRRGRVSSGGPRAIGRAPDELRRNGVAGTPDEVAAAIQRWPTPAPSGSTCRSSTSPTSTTWTPSPPCTEARVIADHHGTVDLERMNPQAAEAVASLLVWQPSEDRRGSDAATSHKAAARTRAFAPKAERYVTTSTRCVPTSQSEGASARPIRSRSGCRRSTNSWRTADPLGELRLIQERRDLAVELENMGDEVDLGSIEDAVRQGGRQATATARASRTRRGARSACRPPCSSRPASAAR